MSDEEGFFLAFDLGIKGFPLGFYNRVFSDFPPVEQTTDRIGNRIL